MHPLPKLTEVETHLIGHFIKRGNRATTPREVFRTTAHELGLGREQLGQTVMVAGVCRNAWQQRCEAVWRDLEQRGRVEQRSFAHWALNDQFYKRLIASLA